MVKKYNGRALKVIYTIYTDDESWIYAYEPDYRTKATALQNDYSADDDVWRPYLARGCQKRHTKTTATKCWGILLGSIYT